MWGCSSVGRAPALQAGGQRFDPVQLHQPSPVRRGSARQAMAGSKAVVPEQKRRQTKSNSMLPDRRRHNRLRSGSRLGISPSGLGRPVSTAPGRAFLNETTQKVWMFDNEIDWVIAHRAMVPRTGCREAAGRALVTMTRIQGRAHCRAADAQALAANASVQCKKSVFRSSSQDVREHGRVALKAKLSRLSLIRTEAIRLPALELILWSSY